MNSIIYPLEEKPDLETNPDVHSERSNGIIILSTFNPELWNYSASGIWKEHGRQKAVESSKLKARDSILDKSTLNDNKFT